MISLHLSNEEKTYLNRSEVNKLSYPLMDRAWINAKKSSVSALDEGNRQKKFYREKRNLYEHSARWSSGYGYFQWCMQSSTRCQRQKLTTRDLLTDSVVPQFLSVSAAFGAWDLEQQAWSLMVLQWKLQAKLFQG